MTRHKYTRDGFMLYVSPEVLEAVRARIQTSVLTTPDAVLRDLLGLPPGVWPLPKTRDRRKNKRAAAPSTRSLRVKVSFAAVAPAKSGEAPWALQGAVFPHGTRFDFVRGPYRVEAIVDDGRLYVPAIKKHFDVPSAAAMTSMKELYGDGRPLNGWETWFVELDRDDWRRMDCFRPVDPEPRKGSKRQRDAAAIQPAELAEEAKAPEVPETGAETD